MIKRVSKFVIGYYQTGYAMNEVLNGIISSCLMLAVSGSNYMSLAYLLVGILRMLGKMLAHSKTMNLTT